jgi:hypothetical protein
VNLEHALPIQVGITSLAFMPPIVDVIKSHPASGDAKLDVRIGEAVSLAVIGTTGVVLAAVTGTMRPLIVSAISALLLLSLYESALRTDLRKVLPHVHAAPGKPSSGPSAA